MFFFNDTATTEIYTLSLHDALPICPRGVRDGGDPLRAARARRRAERRALGLHLLDHQEAPRASGRRAPGPRAARSEEHTSELQSRQYLVCRLLLEKKNKSIKYKNQQ